MNLGNVSEDILKDGRRFYENGMPTPTIPAQIDSSVWGKVPINPIQVTNAFSNNAEDRKYQDVGFDGMTDDEERIKRADVISQISNPLVAQQFIKDPSADNYVWYRDAQYDAGSVGICSISGRSGSSSSGSRRSSSSSSSNRSSYSRIISASRSFASGSSRRVVVVFCSSSSRSSSCCFL